MLLYIKSTNCNNILLIITVLYAIDGVFPFILSSHSFSLLARDFLRWCLTWWLYTLMWYYNIRLWTVKWRRKKNEYTCYKNEIISSMSFATNPSKTTKKNIGNATDDAAIKMNLFHQNMRPKLDKINFENCLSSRTAIFDASDILWWNNRFCHFSLKWFFWPFSFKINNKCDFRLDFAIYLKFAIYLIQLFGKCQIKTKEKMFTNYCCKLQSQLQPIICCGIRCPIKPVSLKNLGFQFFWFDLFD